jgi:hypothetical protein
VFPAAAWPTPILNGIVSASAAQLEQLNLGLEALFDFDGVDADGPLVLAPCDHPPIVSPGSIRLDDATVSDWLGVSVCSPDPVGCEDPNANEVGGTPAVDMTGVSVAQEKTTALFPGIHPDSYYFRVDFAAGTPDPTVNFYSFALRSNEIDDPFSDGFLVGFIADAGGQRFTLDLFRYFSGSAVIAPDPSLVQAGPGFLEFRIPKDAFVGVIPDGAEYVFMFASCSGSCSVDMSSYDTSSAIRLVVEL